VEWIAATENKEATEAPRVGTQTLADGVIQFEAIHAQKPLGARGVALAAQLNGWRSLLRRLGVIGREVGRYGGVGFGNVSVRCPPWQGGQGERAFGISGTQTGHLAWLAASDVCVVSRWDAAQNRVWSEGEALPSSESMSHGTLYDADEALRCVLHVHCPILWRAGPALGLAVSDPRVGYGTPAMAAEVRRLWAHTAAPAQGLILMGGHEDGVLAFGQTVDEAGARLMGAMARATGHDLP
jgi:hypothetical protein